MSWIVACRVMYQLGEKHLASTSCVPPSTVPMDDVPLPQVAGKIRKPAGENIEYHTAVPKAATICSQLIHTVLSWHEKVEPLELFRIGRYLVYYVIRGIV